MLLIEKKRKAQTISMDFYTSLIIFIMILGLSISLWDDSIKDVSWSIQVQEMNNYANKIADSLIRSQGYPLDWTNETVDVLGLVEKSHILNHEKALEMKNISSGKMAGLFGYAPYKLYIQVNNISDMPVLIGGVNVTWGNYNHSLANSITKTTRHALLNNNNTIERVSILVYIWN